MPKIKSFVTKGFTLVELLVVVALIGILAVAVLSTINPIEQANRARDAKYKNDAAEIVNAEERYYTTLNEYPWSVDTDKFSLNWVGANSISPDTGICAASGTTGCPNPGKLITGQELRNEFAARSTFDPGVLPQDKLYIGRSGESSGSVYVCFIPASSTTRNTAGTADNKLKEGFVADNTIPVPDTGPDGCSETVAPTALEWNDPATACMQCVPE